MRCSSDLGITKDTEIEAALRNAYNAFYELPWKSDRMFNVMHDTAKHLFSNETKTEGTDLKLANKFLDAFENNAATDEQKIAIENLMRVSM